jgi:outer membrane protein assembly factor BamB
VVKKLPPEEFGAEQQTPVWYGGAIFGIKPDGQMACMTRDGVIKWTGGPANPVGAGPLMVADGSVYALGDTGTLYAVEARPDQFVLQGKGVAIAKGRECWGPIAIAGGKMVVRDLKRVVCLEMSR